MTQEFMTPKEMTLVDMVGCATAGPDATIGTRSNGPARSRIGAGNGGPAEWSSGKNGADFFDRKFLRSRPCGPQRGAAIRVATLRVQKQSGASLSDPDGCQTKNPDAGGVTC